MNLSMKQTHRHREQAWLLVAKGRGGGEGQIGSSGLTNYYV